MSVVLIANSLKGNENGIEGNLNCKTLYFLSKLFSRCKNHGSNEVKRIERKLYKQQRNERFRYTNKLK